MVDTNEEKIKNGTPPDATVQSKDNTSASDESDRIEIITDDPKDEKSFGMPGPLRGTSKLILETRHGQFGFEGRKPNPEKNVSAIIGLKSFASYLRTIWDAASDNDPYADWWLLKVERMIEEKEKWFEQKLSDYLAILNGFKNLNHEVAHSISPLEKTLRFSIPYSFRGAMLLMKQDELVKTIMTATHVGLVESEAAHKEIKQCGKAIRVTFQTVTGYRFTGVTRDDVHAMNPVAQKAAELMGPCPIGILDDEVVPKFESSKSMMLRKFRLDKAKQFKESQKS